jgi:hypothetical protein
MASVSMADISIKGDAYLQYADNGIDESGSKTKNTKRVNLNVIGKFGATKVVAATLTCVVLAICFVPAVVTTTPPPPTVVLLTRVETSPNQSRIIYFDETLLIFGNLCI